MRRLVLAAQGRRWGRRLACKAGTFAPPPSPDPAPCPHHLQVSYAVEDREPPLLRDEVAKFMQRCCGAS